MREKLECEDRPSYFIKPARLNSFLELEFPAMRISAGRALIPVLGQ